MSSELIIEKEKYYRWHPALPDVTGAFRGCDPGAFDALNRGTMIVLHEEALREDQVRK